MTYFFISKTILFIAGDFTIIREAETKNIQTENNGCGWVGNREYNFKVILKYPLLRKSLKSDRFIFSVGPVLPSVYKTLK